MNAAMRMGIRAATASALAAGALTLALFSAAPAHAQLAPAVSADSGLVAANTTAAAPCRKAASAHNDTIRLWYCNGTQGTAHGYHAQALMYPNPHTSVTLRTGSGYVLRRRYADAGGVLPRWYNTSTYNASPSGGGLFKACVGYMGSVGVCTGVAS